MPTILLLGTLDTKGAEYAFVRDRLTALGAGTVVVDVGVLGEPGFGPDVTADEVARAAGTSKAELAGAGDRGRAMLAMADGAAAVVRDLHRAGRFDAALALGGTGGTSVAARAFRELPIGVPKIIVSTAASGETSQYVGETDLILAPSVVDVAGVNRVSAPILANAAAAIAGMAAAEPPSVDTHRPLVAASMFGVTTPCITAAREELQQLDYETLTFHMTGTGGRSLEALTRQGVFAGLLDITTTELADELVGGVFSAGSGRLTAAAETGVAQVVSVGALDMVNFGPLDTVPEKFRDRNLYVHNSSVTLMRTTPEECSELGTRLATRVSAATGPAVVLLPLRGVSAIAVDGGPFHDPAADDALFEAIREHLDRDRVELVELDAAVNDTEFALAAARTLHDLISR